MKKRIDETHQEHEMNSVEAALGGMMKVKIIDDRLKEWGFGRATMGSAAYDLRACIDSMMILEPGNTAMIPTGIAIQLPTYQAAMLLPRSGLGANNGIVLANLVGLIDSDYRGEVKAALWNRGHAQYAIKPGDRIAQMVVVVIGAYTMEIVEDLDETDRGDGGFGSSGVDRQGACSQPLSIRASNSRDAT